MSNASLPSASAAAAVGDAILALRYAKQAMERGAHGRAEADRLLERIRQQGLELEELQEDVRRWGASDYW